MEIHIIRNEFSKKINVKLITTSNKHTIGCIVTNTLCMSTFKFINHLTPFSLKKQKKIMF